MLAISVVDARARESFRTVLVVTIESTAAAKPQTAEFAGNAQIRLVMLVTCGFPLQFPPGSARHVAVFVIPRVAYATEYARMFSQLAGAVEAQPEVLYVLGSCVLITVEISAEIDAQFMPIPIGLQYQRG